MEEEKKEKKEKKEKQECHPFFDFSCYFLFPLGVIFYTIVLVLCAFGLVG